MSTARSLLYFAVAGALAFAASSCGGGGGGPTAFSPPVLPSACPSPNNVYPPLDCSQYSTSGTSAQTITRYYPTPPPPPDVTDVSVQQQITVKDGQSFHGRAATDFHTLETDTGPNQAIETTSDVYFIFPSPSPGGQIINIGFHSTDSNGVVLDVQNLSGNGIVGEVPLPNNGGWANNAAQIISETDPDGTQTNMTFNDDGTYSLTKNEAAGQTTACDNPDGSGSANIPSNTFFEDAASTDMSVSAPSEANQITYTLTGLLPSPSPTPLVECGPSPSPTPTPEPVGTIVETFPAWYAVPVVIASDQTTIEGTTAIPAGCTALAANGTQLHEVKSSLDPVFGTTDAETNDTWVASSFGPVCQQIADTQDIYYDFTGQSNPIVLGLLTQKTQTSELLGLQTAVRADAIRRMAGKQSVIPLPLGVQVALANARLERMQILTRLRLLRALEHRTERGFMR
jgi:YD repeat-containing protein